MSAENIVVHASQIIGTERRIYTAWELGNRKAGEWTFFDGVLYGRIGTDPDASLFEHLPRYSEERKVACNAAYAARRELAYELILAKHPEITLSGTRWSREIEVIG